jgi:hypothetical protein
MDKQFVVQLKFGDIEVETVISALSRGRAQEALLDDYKGAEIVSVILLEEEK